MENSKVKAEFKEGDKVSFMYWNHRERCISGTGTIRWVADGEVCVNGPRKTHRMQINCIKHIHPSNHLDK